MGRSGGGGGGRSGGGSRGGRSSGGRRMSSGRSGGSSYRSSSSRSSYGGSYHGGYHHHHHGGYYGRSSLSPATVLIKFIIIFAVLALHFVFTMVGSIFENATLATNSRNRERISSGYQFTTDAVFDDIYWIDNKSYVTDGMRDFYDKTGIQPVIMLKDYQPNLSDADLDAMTVSLYEQYYDDREDIFLYVYYDSAPNDSEDGYHSWCIGSLASSVMDDEALDIFWNWLEYYWFGDQYDSGEEDELYGAVFRQTGNTIMEKSNTIFDVGIIFFAFVIIVVIASVIVFMIKAKHKREREKAAETQRILNSDMDTLTSSYEEDLVDKYN